MEQRVLHHLPRQPELASENTVDVAFFVRESRTVVPGLLLQFLDQPHLLGAEHLGNVVPNLEEGPRDRRIHVGIVFRRQFIRLGDLCGRLIQNVAELVARLRYSAVSQASHRPRHLPLVRRQVVLTSVRAVVGGRELVLDQGIDDAVLQCPLGRNRFS